MATSTFSVRLIGGRNLTASYDNIANTLTVAGQALTLSTLSAALQSQFATALASGTGADPLGGTGIAAFAGDNVSAAIGAIMDQAPSWRAAIAAAVAGVRDDASTMSAGT